ncbi:hypothetical protein ABW19_dt0206759 [Dactylella cylindrospora]|nr:hypothetical protein ABW19_dt0206759 [Dactylella cylindrospora]
MSLFDDGDAALLIKWVVGRLENISDADSDVLADYVLALLRHEQSEDEVKQMCIDQLDDFLREHTSAFVNELFATLRSKSYLSVNSTLHGGLLPSTSATASSTLAPTTQTTNDDQSSDDSYTPKSPGVPFTNPSTNVNTKKRGFYDRDAPGSQNRENGHYSGNSRTKGPKMSRRGGSGRGGGPFDANEKWTRGGGNFGRGGGSPQKQLTPLAIPPVFPMGAPQLPLGAAPLPFGSDPMTQLLAVQAMASIQNGWNPLAIFQPGMMPKPENRLPNSQKRGVCHSFQAKGHCRRGDQCPYQHISNQQIVPPVKGQDEDEYDPHTPMLSPADLERRTSTSFPQKPTPPTRGGQRGGRGGTRGGRSEFSSWGPPRDTSNKSLIVESIPDDKLDEQSLRSYFTTFGTIESVDVKLEKKLAILKFENHEDAKKAHSSPEPIFNNRFVKVYWSKTEGDGESKKQASTTTSGGDEMDIDMEDFQRKQTEAQKAYEEKQAKKKEIEDQAKKLEQQKVELLKRQEEEKKKLLAKLAKKHAVKDTNGTENVDTGDKDSKEAAQTAALKAQLEALEAEASSLGIDHAKLDEALPDFGGGFRGRGRGFPRARGGFGGFSSRGAYVPRGRAAYGAYRGGFAARGATVAKKMTLDNRTKTVMVNGVPDDSMEALQQFMLACGSQYTNIEKNLETENSQIITFSTRGDAARFYHSNLTLPQVGKFEVTWVETNKASSNGGTPGAENGVGGGNDGDVELGDVENQQQVQGDLDAYDVYDMADEDDSRWG